MSAVLERVAEKVDAMSDKVRAQMESKRFSMLMRRETWSDHERAEYSDFEQALVRGTIPIEAYRQMMAQIYFVYVALEEKSAELKGDAVAGSFYIQELHRTATIEEDLVHFFGADWASQIEMLPVTADYVARIRNATPGQFVAHHYTRYLADLSGGLMIYASLKKAWNTEWDGLRYYDFSAIPDPVEFKNKYRTMLDELPVDTDEKMRIIEETLVAYEFNIELINELSNRYLAGSAN